MALWGLNYALAKSAVPTAESVWPVWFAGTQTVLEAIAAVAPGLVAGWIAKVDGLALGAIVGVFVPIMSLLLVLLVWGAMPLEAALQFVLFASIAGLITQPLAGLAGQILSARRSAV